MIGRKESWHWPQLWYAHRAPLPLSHTHTHTFICVCTQTSASSTAATRRAVTVIDSRTECGGQHKPSLRFHPTVEWFPNFWNVQLCNQIWNTWKAQTRVLHLLSVLRFVLCRRQLGNNWLEWILCVWFDWRLFTGIFLYEQNMST